MSDLKLTPEEYAQLMKQNKPHLIELEDHFEKVDYGEVEVKFIIRAGVVNQMQFYETKTWLKPKDLTQK